MRTERWNKFHPSNLKWWKTKTRISISWVCYSSEWRVGLHHELDELYKKRNVLCTRGFHNHFLPLLLRQHAPWRSFLHLEYFAATIGPILHLSCGQRECFSSRVVALIGFNFLHLDKKIGHLHWQQSHIDLDWLFSSLERYTMFSAPDWWELFRSARTCVGQKGLSENIKYETFLVHVLQIQAYWVTSSWDMDALMMRSFTANYQTFCLKM